MTTENNLSAEPADKPKTGKGSGRGGARPNSGRKKRDRKGITIRLSDAERAKLDELRGNMGISDFIRVKLGLASDNTEN